MGFCPSFPDVDGTLNGKTVIEFTSGLSKASLTRLRVSWYVSGEYVRLPFVVYITNFKDVEFGPSNFSININHRLFHNAALVPL